MTLVQTIYAEFLAAPIPGLIVTASFTAFGALLIWAYFYDRNQEKR